MKRITLILLIMPFNVYSQKKSENRDIVFISAPSNLGLMKMAYADKLGPGVRKMASVLDEFKFCERLAIEQRILLKVPGYSGKIDRQSGVRNHDRIIKFTKKLASVVTEQIEKGKFPIVSGGDCSILLGSALAMKMLKGKYGLAHIDGHTDFAIGNRTSSTHGAAGMDLALVTGRGHHTLTNIKNKSPYVYDSLVGQFGNRYTDDKFNGDFYSTAILKADLSELRKTGIEQSVNAFLKRLHDKKAKGFWIHVDLDVLNDEIMRAVDARQPDGLHYHELRQLIRLLLQSGKAIGIQFTVYDPDLDKDKRIGKKLVEEMVAMFSF